MPGRTPGLPGLGGAKVELPQRAESLITRSIAAAAFAAGLPRVATPPAPLPRLPHSNDIDPPEGIALLSFARVSAVRDGLPYAELERLQGLLAVSASVAAGVLGIPERTLSRRKGGKLAPEEGDRVDRVLRVYELGRSVLGDDARVQGWLHAPNRGLGGVVPLTLLDTDRGIRAVEEALLRLEEGIYG